MKKLLILILVLTFKIGAVQAACDFIINIGDKSTKIVEKFAEPLPMFKGKFMLPVQSLTLIHI